MKKWAILSLALLAAASVGILVVALAYRRHVDSDATPIVVALREVVRIPSPRDLPGTWWKVIKDDGAAAAFASDYGVALPSNDYSSHFILVSAGREVRRLTFTRSSRGYGCLPDDGYLGEVTLGRQLTPRTIYVYEMDCLRIYDEEAAGGPPVINLEH